MNSEQLFVGAFVVFLAMIVSIVGIIQFHDYKMHEAGYILIPMSSEHWVRPSCEKCGGKMVVEADKAK